MLGPVGWESSRIPHQYPWTANRLECRLLARWRPHALVADCPLTVAELTLNLQCPLFQRIGLLAKAKPTWVDDCTWSPVDPEQTFELIKNKRKTAIQLSISPLLRVWSGCQAGPHLHFG